MAPNQALLHSLPILDSENLMPPCLEQWMQHSPASSSSEEAGGRRISSSSSSMDFYTPGSTSSNDSTSAGEEDSSNNNTNVYVSELPPNISLNKFRSLFAPFGVIIGARLVPRRKGYLPVGFVQYTTCAAAHAAIATMDRKDIGGTTLSVRLARRDKDKGINNKPSTTLYVANLPRKFVEADLRAIFSQYGDVRSLLIFKHPDTGASKGAALVRFTSLSAATLAKETLHCSPIKGQDLPMEVKYAESRRDKEVRSEGHAKKVAPKNSDEKVKDNSNKLTASALSAGSGNDVPMNIVPSCPTPETTVTQPLFVPSAQRTPASRGPISGCGDQQEAILQALLHSFQMFNLPPLADPASPVTLSECPPFSQSENLAALPFCTFQERKLRGSSVLDGILAQAGIC